MYAVIDNVKCFVYINKKTSVKFVPLCIKKQKSRRPFSVDKTLLLTDFSNIFEIHYNKEMIKENKEARLDYRYKGILVIKKI